ncbi:hypothetical protein [[Mycobacterium] nativiensis]|uniref:DUF1214 domain-containing protein n=1 Tax=[Mycobacterium] nativiensis TaxID=2855503 RepID=A0ABU5Y1U2_9MYCO|nr:hypothetical protein [Mycolicibacter sp. MYC340]MEB3034165.1 hypothetical protein [Mycolicibacter sp. MYC340]
MSRIGSTQRAAVERANCKAARRRRARQRLRVVAAMAPGAVAAALAMTLATPHAVAEMAPSGAMQSIIDQLLDAQHQVTDTNSNYPFILPSDLSSLPQYVQNLASTDLISEYGQMFNPNTGIPWLIGLPWDANSTDPGGFYILVNPDNQYGVIPINADGTYTMTVHPGPGSVDVTFTTLSGTIGSTQGWEPTGHVLDLSGATPNADGSYTVTFSSTPQSGNWIDTTGAENMLIRNTIGNSGLPHDSFSIQQDGVAPTYTLPFLSDSQLSSLLTAVAKDMPITNADGVYYDQTKIPDSLPPNWMTPVASSTSSINGLMPGQLSTFGHFQLDADQALIIKVPNIDAGYSGLELANAWGQNVPIVTAQGSLNSTDTFADPDGYTYYVVSSKDPGVANWINNGGLANGMLGVRWQDVATAPPSTAVHAEVVNIADVKSHLPADTPVISPEEQAALLHERLLNWNYTQDQDHNINWLGANLLQNQIEAAMGHDAFTQIFGSQADAPTVWDRLSDPALMPNLDAVGSEFLTNPAGAMAAFVGNLPLAFKDIELPMLLAMMSSKAVADQTWQGLQGDFSSGDLTQAWTTLTGGLERLGTVFDTAWEDPATGIIAGLLNARDDMSTGILHAGNSFDLSPYSPLMDSLVDLNHQVMAALLG